MTRHWAVAACLAGFLLAVYAENVDTVQTTEVIQASDENSSETVIPTECPQVDSVGNSVFLAHELDCTKFYACANGRKILMQCALMDDHGNRLYFNGKLQMCDWPRNSACTNKNTTDNPATDLPTTENPTHQPTTEEATHPSPEWSTVTNDSPHIPTSDVTTHSSTEWTTMLEDASNTKETTYPPTAGTTDYITVKPTSPIPTEATTSLPIITPNPGVSDLCPSSGFKNGTSYPHECSCEKYYICTDAGLVLHQCSDKTHFNPKLNACDKPENVNCSIPPPATQPPPTTPGAIPTECPNTDPAKPVQIAHPTNCTLYYRCVKGEKVLKSCSTPLHFNPQLQLCDWPESAGCTAKEQTTPTPPVTSTTPKPSDCPADSNRTLIPHETACSMFYICDKGQKKLAGCVPGLEFNSALRVCDSPAAAGCSNSSVTPEFIVITDDFDARTSDESDDHSGESTELRRHGSHSAHHHESNDGSCGCIGECPHRNPTEAIQLSHHDCNKFCKCHSGKPHVLNCPSKLHYNPVEQICDHPQDAGCKGSHDKGRK